MRAISVCPGLLIEGYTTYSPKALRVLFDGKKVSPWLDFNVEDEMQTEQVQTNMQNLSISGAQEKLMMDIFVLRMRENRVHIFLNRLQ